MYIPAVPPPPAREGKPRPLQPHPEADHLPLGDAAFFCTGFPSFTPAEFIMSAAVKGDIDRLRLLLARNGNLPDFANSYGITPLMAAAAHGHADIVKLLASEAMTDINRACKAGLTALHYAAHWGRADCVRTLMQNGADFLRGPAPAYLFAADQAVQEAFQENKKCRQQMSATSEQKAEEKAAAPAAAPSKPKKEFSFADILVMDKNSRFYDEYDIKATAKNFVSLLPEMDKESLEKFIKWIRSNKPVCSAFPWTHIFVDAARCGNVMALIMIDEILNGPQSGMLENALAAVIEAGDDRHTAHILLQMGARAGDKRSFLPPEMGDPPERFRLYQRALLLERGGILEEMVLWNDGLKGFGEKEIVEARKINRAVKTYRALDLCAQKIKAKNLKSSPLLRIAFTKAVEEKRFDSMMVIYAENCHNRFLRAEKPLLSLDKDILRSAFILALKNEKHDFALKMLSDGYSPVGAQASPQDAEFLASERASAESKAIFRDAVSGRIKLTPITPAYMRKARDNIFVFPMTGV